MAKIEEKNDPEEAEVKAEAPPPKKAKKPTRAEKRRAKVGPNRDSRPAWASRTGRT